MGGFWPFALVLEGDRPGAVLSFGDERTFAVRLSFWSVGKSGGMLSSQDYMTLSKLR